MKGQLMKSKRKPSKLDAAQQDISSKVFQSENVMEKMKPKRSKTCNDSGSKLNDLFKTIKLVNTSGRVEHENRSNTPILSVEKQRKKKQQQFHAQSSLHSSTQRPFQERISRMLSTNKRSQSVPGDLFGEESWSQEMELFANAVKTVGKRPEDIACEKLVKHKGRRTTQRKRVL